MQGVDIDPIMPRAIPRITVAFPRASLGLAKILVAAALSE
jgi:hypothetical protein